MEKQKYQVTCLYCEFFKYYGPQEPMGDCRKKDIKVNIGDEICDDFELRSGLYTTLTYPKK